MKYSKVDVFHGTDLSEVVTQAQEGCPPGYEVVDLDVKFLNNFWVVVSKIALIPAEVVEFCPKIRGDPRI